MKKIILALLIIGVAVLLAPSIANAACNGVTICGTNYDCGVADGVCPEDFSSCDSCNICDPDCGNCGGTTTGGGTTGGQNYQCSHDVEAYTINSIKVGQVFKTIEDRYCTDLHFYSLETNTNLSNVVIKINLIHPEVIPPEGKVYDYYNVTSQNIKNSNVKELTFRYRVLNSWINNNSVAENKVILYKQKNVFWERLDSRKIDSDEFYSYYAGEGSNSFGTYAIVGHGLEIWDVLKVINLYYAGETSFSNVINTLDKYYSF